MKRNNVVRGLSIPVTVARLTKFVIVYDVEHEDENGGSQQRGDVDQKQLTTSRVG